MTDPAYPDGLPAQYRLHWYVLERVLGQGGFGITYLARDTNLDQAVAIKEYLPLESASRQPDATVRPRSDGQNERFRWGLDRFIREARTLARFDHPNIVRVHSVFESNNTAYMVMRFEEGENLAARLERRRTIPEDELIRILLPILDGLELVHGAGFIHRDIKPDNIHIRADGTPVLLDFGSARHALGHARTVTILVAPGYAPFEQYYSTGENQGPWTDLYGLGATCYRALAGTPPIDAIARSKGILGSTREVLVPSSVMGSGRYSPRLLKAIDHALEFAEKDRPQSIAEWRKEIVGESPAVPRSPAPIERKAEAKEPSPQAVQAPAAQAPKGGAVGPIVWATAGGAAVAVGVAIALLLYAPMREPDRGETQRMPETAASGEPAARPAEPAKTEAAEKLAAEEKRRAEERARDDAERNKLAEDRKALEEERKRLEEHKRLAEETKRTAKSKPETRRPVTAAAAPPMADRPTLPSSAASRAGDEPKAAAQAPSVALVAPKPAPSPSVARPEVPAGQKKDSEPGAAKEALAVADRAFARGDYTEATNLYRRAASAGDSEAQLKLGEMYENGRGVTQNFNQAYIWYGLAAHGGNAAAKARKEKIATRLQPAEIQQADRLIESRTRSAR